MGNKNSIDKSYHKYDSSLKMSADTDKDNVNEKESCMSYYFNNSNLGTIGQTKKKSIESVQKKSKKNVNKPKQASKIPSRKDTEDHLFTDSDEAECGNLKDWVGKSTDNTTGD